MRAFVIFKKKMGWEIIVLMAGAIFSFFTLLLQKDGPENDKDNIKRGLKWCSILLILIGVVAACIDTFDKKASETVNTNNLATTLKYSDSTLTKINRATYILDSVQRTGLTTIDSLKDVQQKAKAILDSMGRQLNLQNRLNMTAERITKRSHEILIKQDTLLIANDRLLHPFFPVTFTIDFELPFTAKIIQPLMKYLTGLKTDIESKKVSSPQYDIQNNRSAWFNRNGLTELPLQYQDIKDPALSFDSLFEFNFEISIIKTESNPITSEMPLLGLDKNKPQQHFIVGNWYGNIKPVINLNVDYNQKSILFSLRYENYPYVGSIWHETTAYFGSNELLNCYLILGFYSPQDNPLEVKSVWFSPHQSHPKPLLINFGNQDIFHGKFSIDRYYCHKIVASDFQIGEYHFR